MPNGPNSLLTTPAIGLSEVDGEGVGCGMFMAATLSHHQNWINHDQLQRIKNLIKQAGLPLLPPASMTLEQFIEIMAIDKKNIDAQIRLILMKELGQSFISDDYDNALLHKTIEEMLKESQKA